ncbi:hypothetical protein TCE0_060f18900 [Talaromyces pinophilus]|uniref:Vacuolar ATPase assembly protein VMA22 n=1 Tax=Talaromyces pinophilus TaxID=128442 RepID=A0A6V8HQ01_TALPI|nr:hypothetical protein TCE0_060f18900 [Talaromyces pinophilus]
MSQIPTPPQSRGSSVEPNDEKIDKTTTTLDEKVQLLDNLLERYLHLLDTHQKLQDSLGKQLSSGFFQLTHANYVSPGRRFGEDFYDERMKATRRLNITSLPDDEQSDSERIEAQLERVKFEVEYKSVLEPNDDEEKEEDVNDTGKDAEKSATESVPNFDNEEETKQQKDMSVSGIATPPTQTTDTTTTNDNIDDDTNSSNEKSTKTKKKIFRSDDPISWYGILVPSSLKNAQKSFIEAVDGGIPQIVSVISEMRCVEDMVYELRREIDGSVEPN